ncbi:hypothetical protein [Roseiflexus sp.]
MSDPCARLSVMPVLTGGSSQRRSDGSTGQQRHPVTPLSDMRFSHFAACSPQQAFSPLWKRDAALDAV